jgi:hypothetical protein
MVVGLWVAAISPLFLFAYQGALAVAGYFVKRGIYRLAEGDGRLPRLARRLSFIAEKVQKELQDGPPRSRQTSTGSGPGTRPHSEEHRQTVLERIEEERSSGIDTSVSSNSVGNSSAHQFTRFDCFR